MILHVSAVGLPSSDVHGIAIRGMNGIVNYIVCYTLIVEKSHLGTYTGVLGCLGCYLRSFEYIMVITIHDRFPPCVPIILRTNLARIAPFLLFTANEKLSGSWLLLTLYDCRTLPRFSPCCDCYGVLGLCFCFLQGMRGRGVEER